MGDPGVSLIPRASKATKKRKTAFRPAAKKSKGSRKLPIAAEPSKPNREEPKEQPLLSSANPPSVEAILQPEVVSKPSSPITPGGARKRKANAINSRIQIGSSLRKTTVVSNTNDNSDTGPTEAPKANDENAVPVPNKSMITPSHSAMASVSYPALSSKDQAILNQLAQEGTSKGSLLNSFCSRFKGPKRTIQDASKKAKPKSTQESTSKPSNANQSTTTGAPSVQIIDGEIVLQESSVMLPSRRTVQEVEEEFQDNVVEEDEQLNIVQASYTSFVTKGDHGKTRKKGSWTIEETEAFYRALRQLGTDFGSMEALFFENKRTRKQLKNKYRKELTKNPNLVEELALNPKYQTELDMNALNIDVDPKRVEAHQNEDPPAYEPTDEEAMETVPSQSKSQALAKDSNDFGGELEVVEEDAEEERREEASKALASKTTKAEEWSAETKNEADDGFLDGNGGFERDEGPSMEDFFHDDSYNDDLEEDNGESQQPPKGKEPKVSKAKEDSELVSLVPKKSSSKSRRPKIRPSSRKRK